MYGGLKQKKERSCFSCQRVPLICPTRALDNRCGLRIRHSHMSDETGRVLAALWRSTGLGGNNAGGAKTAATVVFYSAYACACGSYASGRLADRDHGTTGHRAAASAGRLQIRLIQDLNAALLFVAATAVHWCAAAYRRERARVYDERAAVVDRLFGTAAAAATAAGSSTRACCWTLYVLLAVVLSLDVYRYSADGTVPWTYSVAHVWGHYALLSGNLQFAAIVMGLRQCYCRLNGTMRARSAARNGVSPDSGHGVGLFVADVADVSARRSDSSPSNHVVFVDVLDKVNLLTMLKHWCDLHWEITQIVSGVNDLFKFRLFVFFLCGLLHLMLTPYQLSLTILNETNIDILPYIIERTLWFIVHILRVVLMIYPCALLEEEAAKTQILLGSYLNTKIDFFDIKKVETYAQQLTANKPEFSIYSMFTIDKQLVVTLTGAVATYLVIILQLQNQL